MVQDEIDEFSLIRHISRQLPLVGFFASSIAALVAALLLVASGTTVYSLAIDESTRLARSDGRFLILASFALWPTVFWLTEFGFQKA